ncbi:MAG: substrate-binding domain-containing protein [Saprospiraceae bacterium]|nr:substrate-binding domain-containing protein [Candidatus Vicinibacter affinis]MBP6172752.1 substrate-binding domain-containing protein [Saprospiraceae bacterium]MBK6573426.1 substrate-binding domain-containing protein [Candidatus Vicinibacter affinis]MBK6822099.1 substrate-binding domain-containing protein [Candidatus Vicinibacter affinis]MBK7302105.1 substrate-binding domain-containing protein [Candidatus Vicinibacter affinis]
MISKLSTTVSLIFSVLFILCSCKNDTQKESSPTLGEVKVSCDKSLKDLILQQENIFERDYPYAKVELDFLNENDLFNKFFIDSVQTIITCRKLSDSEKDFLHKKQNIHPREFPFATSALAFISSQASRDSNITYEDIIKLVKGIESDGFFKSLVIEDKQSGLAMDLLIRANVTNPSAQMFALNSKEEILNYLSTHPHSLGVVDWSEWSDSDDINAKNKIKNFKIIKISRPIDSIQNGFLAPFQYMLSQGNYPFTRDLFVISRSGKSDLGLGFASFIAGEIGQKIILKAGLLPKYQSDRWIELKNSDPKVVE